MPTTYLIELKLTDRHVVVIGGGSVAARKVAALIEARARVTVISPDFCDELQQLNCKHQTDAYHPKFLEGAELVFACTDDAAINEAVAADARTHHIWCNIADDPAASDFYVPAVLRRGEFTVAVGTAGAAPLLAAYARDQLLSNFGPDFGILVEELGRARQIVQSRVADPHIRRSIFQTLCTECSIKLLAVRDRQAWRNWLERVIEHRLKGIVQDPEPD
jgi:precorrin-2 dehydrogenase/sirohydrochlorin ferrochelatase